VDSQRARLKVNLAEREFEVEGSESFVRAYAERIEALLERLNGPAEPATGLREAAPAGFEAAPSAPQTFGELMYHLPRSASDVDRILVAGYHAQARTPDRSFSTGEANRLLADQGIKLGNPSQCVKQNLVAKRLFKHEGRYRISQTGLDHLRQLLGVGFAG
jgi:hypothetical protein